MAEEDSNVVPFPRGQFDREQNRLKGTLDELPVRTKRPDLNVCRHKRSVVDASARTVECRDCGVSLDPIDVIAEMARNREHLVWQGKHLRDEVTHLTEEVETLKREETNVKARIRRAREREKKTDPLGIVGRVYRDPERRIQVRVIGKSENDPPRSVLVEPVSRYVNREPYTRPFEGLEEIGQEHLLGA